MKRLTQQERNCRISEGLRLAWKRRKEVMHRRFPTTGRGRTRPRGEMNGTERRYAEHLELRKVAGEVEWYAFEAVKLRLAKLTYYTPDFLVMLADGTLEAHEVKGHWEDDARVKIKVAAETFPFRFVAVKALAKKHGGGFSEEEF